MEQLWYTWSSVGYNVATGMRVRACSEGLVPEVTSLERFEALGRHLRYDLPQEREAHTLKAEETATCLAFLKPGRDPKEPSRILVNKRHTSFDAYGRAIFFSHLLANLPESFTARDAITLWKSGFWKYSAEALQADELVLPPVADDLSARQPGPLTAADLRGLQQELRRVILAFLLVVEQEQQVYIAAHPDVVARLIWGLTKVLPRGLLGKLTFSTYEKTAASSKALIVGTCWSSTAQQGQPGPLTGLPPGWKGLALNWYTGEVSPTVREAEASGTLKADFARFAAAALVENVGREHLESLLKRAEKQKITSVEDFLATYEYVVRGNISVQAILASLREPTSAESDLEWPAFQMALLNLASAQPKCWQEEVRPLLALLREQARFAPGGPLAQSLLGLARAAESLGEQALSKQEEDRALVGFEVMEAAAPAEVAPEEWAALLSRLNGARLLPASREVRQVLRRNWARIPERLDGRLLVPWLNFAWAAFETVVRSGYPDAWYPLIMHNWLRQGFPADGAALVSQYPQVFVETFPVLVLDPSEWGALEQFVGAFVQAGGKSPVKLDLLAALLAPKALGREQVVRLFQVARLNADEAVTLLEERAQSGAVEGVFDLLLQDADWRQRGKKAIRQVRSRAGIGQGGGWPGQMKGLLQRQKKSGSLGLRAVLDRLAELTTNQLIAEVQGRQFKRVEFFQELLLDLAPPESTPAPWLSLLERLTPGPGLPESFQPWLLKACATIEHLPWEEVRPWLTGTWPAFSKLFDQELPGTWYLAMLVNVLQEQASPLPKQALELVEKYETWFAETALPALFAQEQYRELLIRFFGQLVKQGYKGKQVFLRALLRVPGVKTAEVEQLWEQASLKEEEADKVLEMVGGGLLQAGHRGHRLLQALAGYLERLAPGDVERQVPLVEEIQRVALPPAGSQVLHGPLDVFVQRAVQQVDEFLGRTDDQQALKWALLLQAAAPPRVRPGSWVSLVGRFSSKDKLYLLAEMLAAEDLKREQAEKYWKAAALTQEEQAEFLQKYLPPLLQDQQVSRAVQAFLRERPRQFPAEAESGFTGIEWGGKEQAEPAELLRPERAPSPVFTNEVVDAGFYGRGATPSVSSTNQQTRVGGGIAGPAQAFRSARAPDLDASMRIIEYFCYQAQDLRPQRLDDLARALQQVPVEQQARSVLIPRLALLIQSRVDLRVVLDKLTIPLGYQYPFELYTVLVGEVKKVFPEPHQCAQKLEPYLLYPFEQKRGFLPLLRTPDDPNSPYQYLSQYLEPALEGLGKKQLKEIGRLAWAPPDFREAWKSYHRLRKVSMNGRQGQVPRGKGWWSKLSKTNIIVISLFLLLILAVGAVLAVLLVSPSLLLHG